MSNMLRLTEEQVSAILAKSKARRVSPLGKEYEPLPSGKPLPGTGKKTGRPRRHPPTVVRTERMVLAQCKTVLDMHPMVAFWWRQNTGGGELANGSWVKFSFTGASDLMGMLRGGRYLAVECKATGKRASAEQAAFLANVADAGGAGICVDDAAKLKDWLDGLRAMSEGAEDAPNPAGLAQKPHATATQGTGVAKKAVLSDLEAK